MAMPERIEAEALVLVRATPAHATEPMKMHSQKTMYSIRFSGTIEPTPPPSWIIAT